MMKKSKRDNERTTLTIQRACACDSLAKLFVEHFRFFFFLFFFSFFCSRLTTTATYWGWNERRLLSMIKTHFIFYDLVEVDKQMGSELRNQFQFYVFSFFLHQRKLRKNWKYYYYYCYSIITRYPYSIQSVDINPEIYWLINWIQISNMWLTNWH